MLRAMSGTLLVEWDLVCPVVVLGRWWEQLKGIGWKISIHISMISSTMKSKFISVVSFSRSGDHLWKYF